MNTMTAPPMDGMASRGRSSTLDKMRGHAPQGSRLNESSSSSRPPSFGSSMRNVRKRHSFFGGSSSDASSARNFPVQHPATYSQPSTQVQHTPARPPTAMSSDQSYRRKAEPLESIRNSIFGARKKPSGPTSRYRGDSNTLPFARNGRFSPEALQWSREHFRSEEECKILEGKSRIRKLTHSSDYKYLRKQSISPPFNFQHVTHTARTQLPALETVDEKDLPGQFWSVSAYQRPRRHLNGIKADDLHQKYQHSGSPTGSSPNSRPISPLPTLTIPTEPAGDRPHIATPTSAISSLDETMFDEVRDTRFDLNEASKPMVQPAKRNFGYPKRFSSLGAPNKLQHRTGVPPQDPTTVYESNSSSETSVTQSESPHHAPRSPENAEALGTVLEVPERPRPEDILYRSTQPLPSVPVQTIAKRSSQGSLRSAYLKRSSMTSTTTPVEKQTSPKSKRSSHSSRSSPKSVARSSSSDWRELSALSDTTWEDDVDFCYDQEAEATCDFNWDFSRTYQPSQSGSGVWPSAESYYGTSPTVSNESSTSLKYQSSNDNIAERRCSQMMNQHKRGSSVGHRGFLAARKNSSADLISQANLIPAPISITRNSTQVSILSPVFSVTGADDDTPKTPLTPGTLHFTGVNTEYLSDPESYRTSDGSRHRKSSSYDSYESSAKPPAANVFQGRDPTRWSVASASSLPDLMHSRPKSKLSFSKTVVSRPLESLPQSPGIQETLSEVYESTNMPRASQIEPVRNAFVVPLPQHPGERAVVQGAGGVARAAPRSRAGTPARFSRVFQPAAESVQSVQESSRAGPEWI